jgi:hypothetical protein
MRVNAFALPGGKIFINTGAIMATKLPFLRFMTKYIVKPLTKEKRIQAPKFIYGEEKK